MRVRRGAWFYATIASSPPGRGVGVGGLMGRGNLQHSDANRGHEPALGAPASWTAAVLCRFRPRRKSARGLAQSKTCGPVQWFMGRIPRNKIAHPEPLNPIASNIQHPTPNIQQTHPLEVENWMLNVGCSGRFMERIPRNKLSRTEPLNSARERADLQVRPTRFRGRNCGVMLPAESIPAPRCGITRSQVDPPPAESSLSKRARATGKRWPDKPPTP